MTRSFLFLCVLTLVLMLTTTPVYAQGGEENPLPPTEALPVLIDEVINKLIVIAMVALTYAIPRLIASASLWFRQQFNSWLQTQPDAVQQAIEMAAMKGARAVEQLKLKGQLQEAAASELKKAAEKYAVSWLEAQGREVTDQTRAAIDAAIEEVILAKQHTQEAAVQQWSLMGQPLTLQTAVPSATLQSLLPALG